MRRLKHQVTTVDHCKGRPEAPVEIVVYGDYQCTDTYRTQQICDRLIRTFAYETRFIFRHFPMPAIHPLALQSAMMAEAAALQNRFWEMHYAMFQRQVDLNAKDRERERISGIDGLDTDRFREDLNKRRVMDKIQRDWESGLISGVAGTPAMFINSTRYTSIPEETELRSYIEILLTGQYTWM